MNQKVGKIERPDTSTLQECCLELSREEQASILHNEDHSTWYGKYCHSESISCRAYNKSIYIYYWKIQEIGKLECF